MKLHPRVTRATLELVKRFEGLRRRAARLPDGGWTVGYGHTRSAREGAVVSPEDADALLYYDLSDVAEKVEAWTFTPLTQNQFEALTAFAFNIGLENFRRSTVLKRVNEGQHLMAAAALELWRKADFGGEDVVVDALVRRRAAEKAHYLTPPEGFRPSPSPVLRPVFDYSVIEAAANSRAGRPAAVVDAPLDGDTATFTLEPPAEDVDREQPAAPVVAAASTTAQLHQLFPDQAAEPEAPAEQPFTLEGAPEVLDQVVPTAVNDGAFGRTLAFGTEAAPAAPSLEVPPPPAPGFGSSGGDFVSFAPPPVRPFEPPPSFEPAYAPTSPATVEGPLAREGSAVAEAVARPASLFDAPSPRASFTPPEGARTMRVRDDGPLEPEGSDAAPAHFAETPPMDDHEPGAPRHRSLIYVSIGLLGVALFAAALFSMFNGKASAVNLVIGLMGILLMTPAGGYFLLRFLNKQDDVDGAETI